MKEFKILYLSVILLAFFVFAIPNHVFASSQENNYTNTIDRGFNASVWSPTQFNLTAGDTIDYVALKTYYHDFSFDHNPGGLADDTGFGGLVFTTKISNGDVPAGSRITAIGLFINSFTNAEVRVKVYTDDNNVIVANSAPQTLVGQSNSIVVTTTGEQDFALTTPATTPTAPNTGSFWVGFEENSTAFHMSDVGSSKWCITGHTYGTGPNSMTGCTLQTETFRVKIYYTEGSDGFVRVKIYNSTSNTRTELLGESASTLLTINGTNQIPVSATVGPSGKIYAGFETLNYTQWFLTDIFGSAIKCTVAHSYGSGPDPFGTCVNNANGPYIGIIYNLAPPNGTNQTLYLTGSLFGATAYFDPTKILIQGPPSANVTEIGLFNQDGLLYDHIFSPVLPITTGSNFTIPYKFNDTNTGIQTYTAQAIVQIGANSTTVTSNQLSFYFGSFTPGKLKLNYTNPLSAPFIFKKTIINSSDTKIDVLYPASFNSSCNLAYKFAQTNHTYNNLPTSQATFQFIGNGSEIVNINCLNNNGNETGNYILTETNFPLVQQIKDLRSGEVNLGTSGKFGAFDLVTLIILILSIIGFNRVNESVGVVFNVALIGACAYFGIIQWPVILSSSVALVLVLIISSTRKTAGY